MAILFACSIQVSAFQKGAATIKNEDTAVVNPWTAEQVIQPAELAQKIIKDSTHQLLVLNIGPVDDIKDAVNIGPVEKKKNLKALKKLLKQQPKDKEIVFYCGCCEMIICPNIKPAFYTLQKMGFTNFKILNIEQNLDQDWISKGYPMAEIKK